MTRARAANAVMRYDAGADHLVPVASAEILLCQVGTSTPIDEVLYVDATSATTLANPFTADSLGRWEAYRATAGPVTARVSSAEIDTYDAAETFVSDQSDDEVSVQDYGASPDAVTLSAAASTTRGSAIVTVAGASFTAQDVGKLISVIPLTAPSFSTAASITASTPTLTTASPAFSTSDLGKTVEVQNANSSSAIWRTTITAFTSSQSVTLALPSPQTVGPVRAAWWAAPMSATILSVLSSTQVTVSSAPTVSVSGADVTWGTDNGLAVQAAITAVSSGASGGGVRFTGGSDLAYLLNQTISVPSGVRLVSDGAVITRSAAMTGVLFDVAAAAENVTFEDLTIDCQHVCGVPAVSIQAGTRAVTITDCEFRDIGNGATIWWRAGSTQHRLVRLTRCRLNRRLPNQGANGLVEDGIAVRIADASYVTVEGNAFNATNAIQIGPETPAACTAANPAQQIVVRDNQFIDAKCTTLNVSSVAGTYAHDIRVDGNQFRNCGTPLEKGALFATLQGTVDTLVFANNVVRGGGYQGSSAGYADLNSPESIGLRGTAAGITNVVIDGNQLDGRPDDATNQTSYNLGITCRTMIDNLKITNNVIQYFGWHGILIEGQDASHQMTGLVIDGNRVTTCVLSQNAANTTTQGAGISILNYTPSPVISNNVSSGHGPSTGALAYTAGIAIGVYTLTTSHTVTAPIFRNNVCSDLGRSRQQYGIMLSYPGGPSHPTGATFDGNIVGGNLTGGIYFDKTSDRQHMLGWNPGYNTALGQPLISTGLTSTGTVDFIIPTFAVPFVGEIIVTQNQQGTDNSSVAIYQVLRWSGGASDIALSAPVTIALGGTAPTVAKLTPATGIMRATNNHVAGTSTIRVFVIPKVLGAS